MKRIILLLTGIALFINLPAQDTTNVSSIGTINLLPEKKNDVSSVGSLNLSGHKNKKGLQSFKYDSILKQADEAIKRKDYQIAKNLYSEALKIKPKQKYPEDQIKYINKQHSLMQRYDSLINVADRFFSNKQYKKAKKTYETAQKIYPEKKYPNNQINKVETALYRKKQILKEKTENIDQNIPKTLKEKTNTYALIIGNEDYKSYQKELNDEQNVDYATRDAKLFNKYCIQTLGIPKENVLLKYNLTASEMHRAVNQIKNIIKHTNGEAEIIFYYAGHGFPNPKNKKPYLIPVDVTGSQLSLALSLKEVYKKLTAYPSKKVMVFLDACFTGGAREASLMASRGVKIVPKEPGLSGNIVVFSASSKDQSALPYKEKKHGLFTYALLKKIKETKGEITLGELKNYLVKEIPIRSTIVNEKEQTPKVNVSFKVKDDWQNWKLR